MKIALFPGSFNPWHQGHENVLEQALKVFDKVHILQMSNKEKNADNVLFPKELIEKYKDGIIISFLPNILLSKTLAIKDACAIVKGLRNSQDMEYETAQQYWNEDMGITIPTFYIITDRNLRHISSSAIRTLKKYGI